MVSRENLRKLTGDELRTLVAYWEGKDWEGEHERTQQNRKASAYRNELERRAKAKSKKS